MTKPKILVKGAGRMGSAVVVQLLAQVIRRKEGAHAVE